MQKFALPSFHLHVVKKKHGNENMSIWEGLVGESSAVTENNLTEFFPGVFNVAHIKLNGQFG